MRNKKKIASLAIQTMERDINVLGGSKMILHAKLADGFKNGCKFFSSKQ
jgi:hypothetical protein